MGALALAVLMCDINQRMMMNSATEACWKFDGNSMRPQGKILLNCPNLHKSHSLTRVLIYSCPFDIVRVHDGIDNTSAVIGTYCGQQRNLVLYSSESNLFIHFFTLQRTANTQNRGFKGIFEFSESFVKLDFIREFVDSTGWGFSLVKSWFWNFSVAT